MFATVNVLGFAVSVATGSHLHLDLLGTGAFLPAAWATRRQDRISTISAIAILLWAGRLASFLFYRALQVRHDIRLDAMLSTTGGALGFWLVSFVWGFICLLPHTLGAGSHSRPRWGSVSIAGGVLFLWGFAWEVLADWQKWWFKHDPGNVGHFCDVGLWGLSQHPNYYGNLCFWTGILILNLPAIMGARTGKVDFRGRALASLGRLALATLCPMLLTALFFGQASGRISNNVQLMSSMFGTDPAYRAYVERVPLIIPRVFGGGS